MRVISAIWWFCALIFALIWERIAGAGNEVMSYGRITDGRYLSWAEYLAAVEELDARNRKAWVMELYAAARSHG